MGARESLVECFGIDWRGWKVEGMREYWGWVVFEDERGRQGIGDWGEGQGRSLFLLYIFFCRLSLLFSRRLF